jgi:hypothetical protein
MEDVCKSYESKVDEFKPVLFKIMHLSIVVHNPQSAVGRTQNVAHAHDNKTWYKILKQFHSILSVEIRTANERTFVHSTSKENSFVDGFIDFAARLCFLV